MAAAGLVTRQRGQCAPRVVTRCGLEVPRGLIYQGWEPGGEYTKTLTLKNVDLKTQRVKYSFSGEQFSSAVYPQPIVLSAGTSCKLPITFRPSKKDLYEEDVVFQTVDGGTFTVPLRALLPRPKLSLPESLKCGMCGVRDSVSVNFEVSNISTLPTDFTWELPEGFSVTPKSGSLAAKESCRLTATFHPRVAKVYNGSAVCRFGEGSSELQDTRTVKLEGVGKYPHVVVKLARGQARKQPDPKLEVQPELGGEGREIGSGSSDVGGEVLVDFGSVAVGSVAEKWIEIVNVSPVPATFAITPRSFPHVAHPPGSLFGCSEYEGSMSPQGICRVKVTFSPLSVSEFPSLGYFSVGAVGGLGRLTVKCLGQPKGPVVSIEESVVSFGNVACGQVATGVMHIKNTSNVATIYQLQMDHQSVFSVDALTGQLGPSSRQTIIVHFSPTRPIPHSRRVTCLVQHHEPLFVHFIGTCFTETVKPVVLQPRHVTNYPSHALSGLSMLPPEQLKQHLKEAKVTVDADTGVLIPSSGLEQPHPLSPHSAYHHYFHSEHEPSGTPHVSVDTDILQFGYCPPTRTSEAKLMSVTNHTQGVLRCVWVTRPSDAFHVLPEEREVQPGQAAAFTFTFKPGNPSQFYAREMECLAFYKELCDYSRVDTATVSPPWCLTVTASGHTFAPGTETFLPRVTFDPRNIVFPATVAGRAVHVTTVMTNAGDTPVLFDIPQDASGMFVVKPAHRLLQDSYQLLALEMTPRDSKVERRTLKCLLNASSNYQQELLLSGGGEVPAVSLGDEAQLFFQPTCCGTTSAAPHIVTNRSRLPLRLQWTVTDTGRGVVWVEPPAGIILPNESQTHTWHFSPQETKHYSLKAVLHACFNTAPPTAGHSPRKTKVVLSIFGQGTFGEIRCSLSTLDCGPVTIGTSQTHSLTLVNPGACSLYYRLHVDTESQGRHPPFDRPVLEPDRSTGVIHAHSQEHVKVTVRPPERDCYHSRLTYQLLSSPHAAAPSSSPPTDSASLLCTVEVSGAYPSLQVTDVLGAGSACTTSKARMWSMLSMQLLNSYLREEPSVSELRYAIATRHSMRRRVPVHTRAVADFNFGAAPVGSESSVVHLMLENTGAVTTQWAFQFPSDMHLEPEYWADRGKMDDVERHELDVVSNELFTVRPKAGRLLPGEKTTIVCAFKHSQIGASKLPVLMKINRGREILLNWRGVTIDHGQPYVYFTSHEHKLSSVPIGLHAHPRQVYELHNAGDTGLSYEIDTGPLEVLREDNYLMSVLECLQPSGDIPAGGTAHVEFVFSPLEVKKYTVDLPIRFSTGETTLVTFTGEGYNPQEESSRSQTAPLPDSQSMPLHGAISIPGQLAKLSQERVALGDIPLFAVVRRLVFVSNTSPHTLSFHWDYSPNQAARQVVSVDPEQGCLQPGRCAACRITFSSHASPACYDLDLVCKVLDESELLGYRLRREEWEGEQEERKHTFTITDGGTTPKAGSRATSKTKRRPVTTPKVKVQDGVGGTGRPTSSPGSELRGKYPALPPIGASGTATPTKESYEEWKKKDLSVRSKARPRKRKTSGTKPPTPPMPLLLHLGVTGHTHAISDYARLFSDLDTFYINQQALMPGGAATPTEGQSGPATPTEGVLSVRTEEKEIVVSILGQMTRELLDDTNFHSAVQRVVEEPIPYFKQFGAAEEPSTPVKQPTHGHSYSSALEHMPSGESAESPLPLPLHMSPAHSPMLSEDLACSEAGTPVSEPLAVSFAASIPEQDTTELDEKLRHMPEFGSLVESILENTLLNTLREASAGELNITAPLYTIAKH